MIIAGCGRVQGADSVDGGDVASSEDAYRSAAQAIIQACEESPELCDHYSRIVLMDCVGGEEEWTKMLMKVDGLTLDLGLQRCARSAGRWPAAETASWV